jgi:hypothetical protein
MVTKRALLRAFPRQENLTRKLRRQVDSAKRGSPVDPEQSTFDCESIEEALAMAATSSR